MNIEEVYECIQEVTEEQLNQLQVVMDFYKDFEYNSCYVTIINKCF